MNSLLRVRDLGFSYPDGTEALRGVDLDLDRGERVALLGSNGAGKTTFLHALIGIVTPQEGTVQVGEVELSEGTLPEVRRRIGIVFQDPDDQLFMPSVARDVAFGPANLGLSQEQVESRTTVALERVGMVEHRNRAPHHLSAGEARRVALATVLAMEPDLLVLDEPTSNLDPVGRRELVELLVGLDTTLLVVTHDLPFALELCPRSVILNAGAVAADGPTPYLLGDSRVMAANRLEIPFGFDPATIAGR
jgi:cobalt/nickel transport system ATP-binding protein